MFLAACTVSPQWHTGILEDFWGHQFPSFFPSRFSAVRERIACFFPPPSESFENCHLWFSLFAENSMCRKHLVADLKLREGRLKNIRSVWTWRELRGWILDWPSLRSLMLLSYFAKNKVGVVIPTSQSSDSEGKHKQSSKSSHLTLGKPTRSWWEWSQTTEQVACVKYQ